MRLDFRLPHRPRLTVVDSQVGIAGCSPRTSKGVTSRHAVLSGIASLISNQMTEATSSTLWEILAQVHRIGDEQILSRLRQTAEQLRAEENYFAAAYAMERAIHAASGRATKCSSVCSSRWRTTTGSIC